MIEQFVFKNCSFFTFLYSIEPALYWLMLNSKRNENFKPNRKF